MLNRVKIQNFKSIGEPGVDLELKPLTFLVGPNGGGKSSILEAIAVLIQNSYSGEMVKFSSWEDTIHKPIANDSKTRVDVFFEEIDSSEFLLGRRLSLREKEAVNFENLIIPDTAIPNDVIGKVKNLVSRELEENTYLISSIRGEVPFRVGAGPNFRWVGSNGQFLILLLSRIFARREYDAQANTIALWANRFGIDGLKAGLWEGNNVGSDYLDSELKTNLNLALSSSGSKQILTVITQLFWSPKGSLLMIEEPEISLHPKAQIDVLEMFAEAINEEDKQIIATTHGLFLIQAIGYAVQKGWLKADQVAVHHIEKKKDVGTVSKQLPVDEKGYIKGWIPSFASVERKLLEEAIKNIPEE